MTQERRQQRVFTDKFKQQVVDLVLSGKPQGQIIKEYDLSPSSLPKWMEQYGRNHSFIQGKR